MKSKKTNKKAVVDVIKMRGSIEMELRGPGGELIERREHHNVVVTAGRAWVLSRIISQSPSTDTLKFIAVGTSTTAPATSDTALVSEAARNSISTFDVTNLSANPPSFVAQCTFATNQANTTLGEAGLFDSSATGTMLSHVTFATIDKKTSNTLAISYTISN
jgi:hypothetical protein